jgi:aquaporin Z
VTVGLWLGKRFPARDVLPYIVAQVVGGIVAAGLLFLIASAKPDFSLGQFASNGYDQFSPGGYGIIAVLITEAVLTFMFLTVILGATDKRAPAGFAGIAIGLCLTLIHLISIPIDNTSVNPARSTGPALIELFQGNSGEISQLWVFWVAPIVGAAVAGLLYPFIFGEDNAA